MNKKKEALRQKLSHLYIPDIIIPKFSIKADDIKSGTIMFIHNACIGYGKEYLLKNINLSLQSKERIAITGDNASGKSTLLKAITNDPHINKTGEWHLPKLDNIGYLDQHYTNLDTFQSAYEVIQSTKPDWSHVEIRKHLNQFLFRKNEEVDRPIENLSGGEKARLSLALIAAKTPRLLILDEITNNLDLETKEHIVNVLKEYPGAIIIVSHEEDFLKAISIDQYYEIKNGKLINRVNS